MMGTSAGPKVVDFSTHLSGPLTSRYLAELGADVIKVEHWRVGDGNRGTTPKIHGTGMIHVNCGPGVRSLAADVRSPDWPTLVEACARWAEVVVVGARPEDARRRGLDFDSVRRINPNIVYCSVTGYGEVGPWAAMPAHGLQIDAYAGNVHVEWQDGQPRVPAGFRTAGTTAAAMFAAMGIWAALCRVREGAPAQHVQTSAWEAAMSWQWRDLTTAANLGHGWTDYADSGTRYATYATSDGRAVLVCPLEKRFWEALCELLDLPELRDRGDWSENGMDWGAGPAYADERALLEERIGAHPLAHWEKEFAGIGIPFAPLLDPREALASEHAQVNAIMVETEVGGRRAVYTRAGVRIVAAGEEPGEPHLRPPPAIGQDTDSVLADLGIAGLVTAPRGDR